MFIIKDLYRQEDKVLASRILNYLGCCMNGGGEVRSDVISPYWCVFEKNEYDIYPGSMSQSDLKKFIGYVWYICDTSDVEYFIRHICQRSKVEEYTLQDLINNRLTFAKKVSDGLLPYILNKEVLC